MKLLAKLIGLKARLEHTQNPQERARIQRLISKIEKQLGGSSDEEEDQEAR